MFCGHPLNCGIRKNWTPHRWCPVLFISQEWQCNIMFIECRGRHGEAVESLCLEFSFLISLNTCPSHHTGPATIYSLPKWRCYSTFLVINYCSLLNSFNYQKLKNLCISNCKSFLSPLNSGGTSCLWYYIRHPRITPEIFMLIFTKVDCMKSI